MKKIMIICSICFIAVSGFAQSPKYTEAMKKALAEMDTASNTEQFLAVSNKFERIALAERNQWLPFYYASLSRVTATFLTDDKTSIDAILDVAQKHANVADSLMPDNSEIVLLKAMVLGGRIMVDPMTRGMQYGMQSSMLTQKALQLDPNNPRAYYMMGQSLFYTPAEFGGGKDKGCVLIVQAKEKYKTFVPASDIHPNWGEEQVDDTLLQCMEQAPPVKNE